MASVTLSIATGTSVECEVADTALTGGPGEREVLSFSESMLKRTLDRLRLALTGIDFFGGVTGRAGRGGICDVPPMGGAIGTAGASGGQLGDLGRDVGTGGARSGHPEPVLCRSYLPRDDAIALGDRSRDLPRLRLGLLGPRSISACVGHCATATAGDRLLAAVVAN